MLKKLILAAGVAFALLAPTYAADPQTFKTEDSATKFCKTGNAVWFNPASKSISTLAPSFTARPRPLASPAGPLLTRWGLEPTRGIELPAGAYCGLRLDCRAEQGVM